MKLVSISILAVLLCVMGYAQQSVKNANEEISKGNTSYKQGEYQKAETAYDEALRLQSSNTIAKFNKANTQYRQQKNTEAIKGFEAVIMDSRDNKTKADGFYNKGVILSGEKKLEESIEAYKNALRQNAADQQARENLQKALLELKKKAPQQQKKEDKKEDKKQPQQPRMNQKEAERRLKLLEQKEKELQQRMEKNKSQSVRGQGKDW